MYKTPRRKHGDVWVAAEFGLHTIGSQAPYMSVTGEEWAGPRSTSDRALLSCGCLHELVGKAFPELRPAIAWHLATDGEPMHYLANAKYWHDVANGRTERRSTDPDPVKAFASTVHWGVIKETVPATRLLELEWMLAEHHLQARREPMRQAFRAVVESLPAIADRVGAA